MSDHRLEPPADDLERLVSRLNSGEALKAAPSLVTGMSAAIDPWLARVREVDGSDLLLVAGRPPMASRSMSRSGAPGSAGSG